MKANPRFGHFLQESKELSQLGQNREPDGGNKALQAGRRESDPRASGGSQQVEAAALVRAK